MKGWSVVLIQRDLETGEDVQTVEIRWFLTYWRANRFWYRAIRDLKLAVANPPYAVEILPRDQVDL